MAFKNREGHRFQGTAELALLAMAARLLVKKEKMSIYCERMGVTWGFIRGLFYPVTVVCHELPIHCLFPFNQENCHPMGKNLNSHVTKKTSKKEEAQSVAWV